MTEQDCYIYRSSFLHLHTLGYVSRMGWQYVGMKGAKFVIELFMLTGALRGTKGEGVVARKGDGVIEKAAAC